MNNMKNGFTKFQIKIITDVRLALREGATLDACAVLIGINYDVEEKYVIDTFKSFIKMPRVIVC